jgi:hypothetical protein
MPAAMLDERLLRRCEHGEEVIALGGYLEVSEQQSQN